MFRMGSRFFRSNRLLLMTIVVTILAGIGYGLSGKYDWLKTIANIMIIVQSVIVASLIVWRVIDALRFGARGVDVLSFGAILVALWAQSYWVAIAACLVHLFVFTIRSFVETRVNRITGLPELKLDGSAIVLRGRKQVVTTVEKLSKGDKILIEANSMIPVDGILLDDKAEVDESWLKGNANVTKSKHNAVYAGSINSGESFTIRAVSSRTGSLVSGLIHTLKTARFTSSPFLNTAEVFSLVYTLVVIVFAVGAFIRGDKAELLATLIASTPLVFIATPKLFFAIAMGKAGRQGIFFKSSKSVELSSTVKSLLVSDEFAASFGKKSNDVLHKLQGYVDNISVLGNTSDAKNGGYLEVIKASNLSEKIIAIENATDDSGVLSLNPDAEHSLLQASNLGIQLNSSDSGLAEAADVYILSEDVAKVGIMKSITKKVIRRCQLLIMVIGLMSIAIMFSAAFGYINAWYSLAASFTIYLLMFGFVLATSRQRLDKKF